MNLPNLMSCLRLLMVPLFAVAFFARTPNAHINAMIIFLAAGVTDLLDGIIARKFNMITKMGKILDPLADKLMLFTVLICSAVGGLIPIWIPAIYFLVEVLQVLGAVKLFRVTRDMLPSNLIGKMATFFFYAAVVIAVLYGRHMPRAMVAGLFVPALALAFSAFVAYYRWAVSEYSKKPDAGENKDADGHQDF